MNNKFKLWERVHPRKSPTEVYVDVILEIEGYWKPEEGGFLYEVSVIKSDRTDYLRLGQYYEKIPEDHLAKMIYSGKKHRLTTIFK